jgi:hypothetical protein
MTNQTTSERYKTRGAWLALSVQSMFVLGRGKEMTGRCSFTSQTIIAKKLLDISTKRL